MAKSKSGHRPGGGIASRNVVQKPVRTGRGASAIIPAGSAQLGARQGNHFTQGGAGGRKQSNYGGVDIYSTGPGYNKARYGNEVAKNVGGGGRQGSNSLWSKWEPGLSRLCRVRQSTCKG